MKRKCSFLLAFVLILSCFSVVFADKTNEPTIFKDVAGTGFETAVTNLVSKDIINGYEDQTFKPLNGITRAEACKIIVMATKPASSALQNTSAAFNDMIGSTWANPYVNLAVSKGIITGYVNAGVRTFKPNNNVTYDEMNAMLVRSLGIKESSLTGTWPESYAEKAKALGIHDGLLSTDGRTGLTGNYGSNAATRGNVAIMVNNVIDQLENGTTSQSSDTNTPSISSNSAQMYFDDIGKTWNEIKQEHSYFEFKIIMLPNAAGECWGSPDGKYSYYFYGTQDYLPLMNMGMQFGDELKCAGIQSTVGEMFPETTDQMPIGEFFQKIGVTEYTYYDDENAPGMGWIEFMYNDMLASLSTIDSEFSYDDFKKVTTMKHSYTVVISDEKIESDNYNILIHYYDPV